MAAQERDRASAVEHSVLAAIVCLAGRLISERVKVTSLVGRWGFGGDPGDGDAHATPPCSRAGHAKLSYTMLGSYSS